MNVASRFGLTPQYEGLQRLICLIEDTPSRWLAQPVRMDAEVDILLTN